jgi:hypothetical protein
MVKLYLETLGVLPDNLAASSGLSELHRHEHQLLHDVGQSDGDFALQENKAETKF